MSAAITTPAVAEYLLLIEPRKDLSDAITEIKKAFYNRYKTQEALKGKPHLTLVNYKQYTSFESRIVQKLRTISVRLSPIAIDLQDYGSFPSHTIYINVVSRSTVQNLVKNIRTHLQGLMKMDKDNKPHFIMEPHITIARRLKPWQYEQGWLDYSHQSFSGRFIANTMVLLRRETPDQKYELVHRFEFQGMAVGASQAVLF
ncbi:2'-5' RNA ligase family protein [Niabella yanshanensis]|uniref:2'-5' RNA ligase family protein n=1 Tax=Niabella yanshanensis TaxID=577386 RepID=A0ABZ0WAR3_9BACT|nr:2'-5' RNA ligase family protein [Niabella yanshanensis]WQD40398.1 2'-5' RNA ligase family protein [Niabella yanshanensis]